MCHYSKKHSWYWFAIWAIVFAGVVYTAARLFLYFVNKDHNRIHKRKVAESGEELFI